ncbi:GDP-mannose 4,6-dehydratase [soil metagenome]
MVAIIFGANGQDGYYLEQLLNEQRVSSVGVSRSGDFLYLDITDFVAVNDLIGRHQPAYIFHLAANSTTGHHGLFDNHNAISTGTINILEAVKRSSPESKVFLSGSGLQFVNTGAPIKETDPFEASSVYSVARIHSVYAARYYRTLGLKIYVGYFFNHESPRRTDRHISKMITEAVKRINNGSDEKIQIGDMSVKKEWTFAKDVMQGAVTLIKQDQVFEAVIGSGIGYSIEEYLHKCFTAINKDWRSHVVAKDNFTAQYKQLVSNPATINSLGWIADTSFDELVTMMLADA